MDVTLIVLSAGGITSSLSVSAGSVPGVVAIVVPGVVVVVPDGVVIVELFGCGFPDVPGRS